MDRLAALPPDIWDCTPPEAQAYMQALEARVTALEGMMPALHAQLKQTSRNSSRPPSSDPPAPPRPRRPRSKRRRGGQPGHPGATRTLFPVEEVDEVVSIKPEACTSCQARLSGDDPTPWRHASDRSPADRADRDRVPLASIVMLGMRRGDPRAVARRGPQWHLWSTGPSPRGVVYGSLSLVQTGDAADDA
jgi:hypothetical protein